MKKQHFILSIITCMMVIFNVKAQNTPIDDFLKKYPPREGVTHVSMSQQMLQSIFAPSTFQSTRPQVSTSSEVVLRSYGLIQQNLNVPEFYSSVSISLKDIPTNLFTDFKNTLLSSKYEQFMEMNQENSNILGYYLKKVNDSINEIVVVRQQKEQFSAIYIKGNIDVNQVDNYLRIIKSSLDRQMRTDQTNMFYSGNQFASNMGSLDTIIRVIGVRKIDTIMIRQLEKFRQQQSEEKR